MFLGCSLGVQPVLGVFSLLESMVHTLALMLIFKVDIFVFVPGALHCSFLLQTFIAWLFYLIILYLVLL